MPERCLQCGAELLEEKTCQTIHEELLEYEMLQSIPHSIHFLHVTCFLIQHERYSDEALTWAQSMLRTHLDEHLTEAQLLRTLRVEKRDQTPARTWRFPRSADALPLPKIAWPVTIVDVARCLQDREAYSSQVKQWASITLQYMYVPR